MNNSEKINRLEYEIEKLHSKIKTLEEKLVVFSRMKDSDKLEAEIKNILKIESSIEIQKALDNLVKGVSELERLQITVMIMICFLGEGFKAKKAEESLEIIKKIGMHAINLN